MKENRILLVEGIHPVAKQVLEEFGLQVESIPQSPPEAELTKLAKNFQILGIRSKTLLTPAFLKSQPQLLGIGAFCIGTNQVDLESANTLGLPVFNAPHSNTRSVAELIVAEMITRLDKWAIATRLHIGENG